MMLFKTFSLTTLVTFTIIILRTAAFERGDLSILENSEMSLNEYVENYSNLDKLSKAYFREIARRDGLKMQRTEERDLQHFLAEKLAFSEAKLEDHILTLSKIYNCSVNRARAMSTYLPYESIFDKLLGYATLSRDIYKVKMAEDSLGGAHMIGSEEMLCRDHFEGYSMINLFYRNYAPEFDPEGVVPVGQRQTSGAILLNHDTRHLVIVFAGTKTGADWSSNLNVIKTGVLEAGRPLAGLELHAGFYQQILDQLPQIEEILDKVKESGSPVKISVTGHSLGGAMSTILAYHLKKAMFPQAAVENITFASPRVFSHESAPTVEHVLGQGNVVRVFNAKDVVCRTPSATRFMHVGLEIKIKSHKTANFGADIEPHQEDLFVGSGSRGGFRKAYRRHRAQNAPRAIIKGLSAAAKERERYHAMKIYVNTLREQFPELDDISVHMKELQDLIKETQDKKDACEARMAEIQMEIASTTFPNLSHPIFVKAMIAVFQEELLAVQNYVKKIPGKPSEKLVEYASILSHALEVLKVYLRFKNEKQSKLCR